MAESVPVRLSYEFSAAADSRPDDPAWLRMSAGAGLLDALGRPVPTIFERVGQAAAEHEALNLGQGFPDEDGPEWLLEAAVRAIRGGRNQYAPGVGLPELRDAVAEHQSRRYGVVLDPGTEVLITAGATEALSAALLAFVRQGDEVISFDPSYDEYGAVIALARGVHVRIPLESDGGPAGGGRFRVPLDRLEEAVTERTRVIIVNDPHNPTGMQFTDEEREAIVAAAARVGALILTDEVYEHQWFARPHRPMAAVPGARERTVSISSAGKTFSVTGWKTGWVTGPAELVAQVRAVKQYLSFCHSAPYQAAVAEGLRDDRGWIEEARTSLLAKRDLMVSGLSAAGWEPIVPEGTFFLLAAPPAWMADPADPRRAEAASLRMPAETGVAGIPVTAFTPPGSDAHGGLVRFAFCKTTPTLQEALRRLQASGA